MNERVDYRNGKYEGQVNSLKQRHGLGIFIDDDLTFYVSHWSQNKINGLSLIYISHGKYIYGEWKNNEPHGLTVFRSGDTVLVGKCKNGRPVSKCLVIFERFNFACILQEVSESWSIIQSGQLVNYDTLIKYIELIEVPVPDHFFSLTKFACYFSKNSHHLKTFPCLVNCCYFGYSNGLALIFNSTNGLISIGVHYNEQLSEFGGRFDGTKSAQEGNFQQGGQRMKYSGERPSNKINGIFQKVHKKSLNFRNEYFDSKIKYFSYIEELLRSKLNQITNQCRKNKSMRHIDLNDSMEYQEYTEEQSFKINSIREHMYEPVSKEITTPSQKLETPSEQEEGKDQKYLKYFRKNPDKPKTQEFSYTPSKQKQEHKESNLSRFKNKQPDQIPLSSYPKKSPLKDPVEIFLDSHKKSQMNFLEESNIPQQPYTPSKLKQKMKSNNLRYINVAVSNETQLQDKKEKNQSTIKSNNIYREIKSTKKADENQAYPSRESQKSEESDYRVPNFNCLSNEKEKGQEASNQSSNKSTKELFIPPTKYYNINKTTFQLERTNINLDKPKPTPLKNELGPSKYDYQPQQSVKPKWQPKQTSLSPKKSISIANLSKPSYEDIEERRKRILKEYKDLNTNNLNKEQKSNEAREIRIDSPCQNMMFSLSKEEQSSFGYMPITMSDKYSGSKPRGEEKSNQVYKSDKKVLVERQNYCEKNNISKKKAEPLAKFDKFIPYNENPTKTPNSSLNPDLLTSNQNISRLRSSIDTGASTSKGTPQRIKKNYNYLYE